MGLKAGLPRRYAPRNDDMEGYARALMTITPALPANNITLCWDLIANWLRFSLHSLMTFAPKHILLPVALEPEDDFNLAQNALESACDIAAQFKSEITLLFVVPPTSTQSGEYDIDGDLYQAFFLLLKARFNRGQELLSKLEKRVSERKVKARVKILETHLNTAQAICDTASEQDIDLIVMGTHARKGLKRLLLGSVATHVSNLSPVTVLLLR